MICNVARVRRSFTEFQVDTCKTKKRYICACTVAHFVVEIQAMIYNAARVRRLSTKYQVNTCKAKIDRSVYAQLRTLYLRSKPQLIMRQGSGGYLQNFKSIHSKLKKIDLCMPSCAPCSEIQAMIYNMTGVRLSTKFQVDTCKSKKDRSGHAQLHTL